MKMKYLALAIATMGFTGQAYAAADDAAKTDDANKATQASAAQGADTKIVVTGSRIRRDNYNSNAPVQIITNEESTLAGFATTTETLQGTSVTAGQSQINNAYGGYVTDGGGGANTIGLRGFGPTRSLVLLNGRRVSPSGTRGSVGAADLNVLPDAIVDRIEVLKDGASSIYGSDAVAGVINVVTRKNIDGVTVSTQQNVAQEGGGYRSGYAIVGGMTGDRFNLTGALEINDRKALRLADRDWATCNTDYRRTYNPTTGEVGEWGSWDFKDPKTGQPKCYPITTTGSNGVTINTLGTPTRPGVAAAGAVGTSFNRWRPNSAVTTGLVGFEGVGGGTNNLNVRDTFDPRTLNREILSPGKVENLYLQGSYDLHALGDAELYVETLANRRTSSQTGYRQLSLDYRYGSPLIPANLRFPTVFSAAQAGGITGTDPIGVRAFIGFGNDKSSQSINFQRFVTGLKGNFFIPGWDYDASVTLAKSKGDYTTESFLIDRMTKSTDVVASGGGFVCRDASGGCVAAPALTAAVIGGQLPQEWINYVWQPVTGTTTYKETTAAFNISGDLFSLPYGTAKASLGAEFRKAKIDDTPPIDSINGNLYNLTSATPTRGSDSVREVFGEIELPLLANVPLAKELTLNTSARYTDYKSYGGDSTFKVGALWAPAGWLTVRATHGTSYRAPALYEQFLGATSGFLASTSDPCNNWDNAANVGSVRYKNCQSEGLPSGFTATTSIRNNTVGGADAGLKAETSKNNTIGIVLQPAMPKSLGNLSFAVDYFDIEVDNGVQRLTAGTILPRCYDDPSFRSGGGLCRLVSARDPGSNALTVKSSYVNVSVDKVSGMDYTARYTQNIGTGKFRANLNITKFNKQEGKIFPEDDMEDSNGRLGSPKYTGSLDLSYTLKAWTVRYGVEWVDGQSDYAYYEEDPATSLYKMDTPDYFLHSLSTRYRGDKWEVVAGVRNITDKEPPKVSSGIANRIGNAMLYSGYDFIGRTFFVNMNKTF